MKMAVGSPQRREIKHWRGLRDNAFDYNEVPTSSCHTFCWKARQSFDVPFFCPRSGAFSPSQRFAIELALKRPGRFVDSNELAL
jgi:hypothetical protein